MDVFSVRCSASANKETILTFWIDNMETHVLCVTLPRRKILRKEGVRNDD